MTREDFQLDFLLSELSALSTEAATTERGDLDLLSTGELIHLMNAEDRQVAEAVGARADRIGKAVDGITERFRKGGRLIYVGAGTAGRIGVLDASECPPTFGTAPGMVVGLVAGGDVALRAAVENAEDDAAAAPVELGGLGLTANDTVVGISASGRTPYVLGGLEYARSAGALTIAIASNASSTIGAISDIAIEIVVGPEFITGSTRLKAGTSQKLVVNMLTTLSMIKLGKTYHGVMVDFQATNDKLVARSVRTVSQLAGVSPKEALSALRDAGGSVKLTLLMVMSGTDATTATKALEVNGGVLREALTSLVACR